MVHVELVSGQYCGTNTANKQPMTIMNKDIIIFVHDWSSSMVSFEIFIVFFFLELINREKAQKQQKVFIIFTQIQIWRHSRSCTLDIVSSVHCHRMPMKNCTCYICNIGSAQIGKDCKAGCCRRCSFCVRLSLENLKTKLKNQTK